MTNMLRGGGHRPDIEALSAHVDGQLDPARMRALNEHLETCEACTAALGDLSQVRTSLQAMPKLAAPRSFRLRVADVEPERKPAGGVAWFSRMAPAAGGIAAVLFVVVFGIDQATQGGGDDASSVARPAAGEFGVIAPDDGSAVAADAAAPQPERSGGAITPPDTGTAIPGAGSTQDGDFADETASGAGSQNEGQDRSAPGPAPDTAAPTGAPPSGNTTIPEAGEAAPTTLAAIVETPAGPSTGLGAAPAETAPAGVVPAPDTAPVATLPAQARSEQIIAATATAELEALSTDTDDDGNRNWLLFVEIAAAMVAVAAGAYLLARRFVGRGAA